MLLIPSLSYRKSKFLKKYFPKAKIKHKRLGNFIINDVLLIKPDQKSKYVLKKFNNIFSLIKWTFLYGLTFYASKYYVSGKDRTLNEIKGLLWARKIGTSFHLHAPEVFEILDDGLIIEFIDGIPIDEFDKFKPSTFLAHYQKVGELLAKVHCKNYSFGDFKAENIFYSATKDRYFFLDFEQFMAVPSNSFTRKVWDVTELFFYLGHIFPSKKSFKFYGKLIFIFLTSYYKNLFSSKEVSSELKNKMFFELGRLKYILIYSTFMSPKTFFFVLKTIQEWKTYFRAKIHEQNPDLYSRT